MKSHTQDFKNNICLLGRQQEIKITYTINNTTTILTGENINSATPMYKADILKSVMKELELDSNIDIPVDTEIKFEYGLLINNSYEYINFGNYIVYSSEKQEDTLSYKIKCYDKLLYSMKDYEDIGITYPITVRNYINSLCTYLGLTFASINDNFTNYEKEIPAELYLDSEGNSLGYTFRDVLDELAQVTGSIICLNNNDELEIRYPNNTSDTINEEYLKDINVNFGEKFGAVNTVILSRSAGADKLSLSNPSNLPDEDKIAIEISDNQIMNFNDRDTYLQALLTRLYGLEFYLNDFTSTGIIYYDIYDKYNVQIGNTIYNCLMLNNEIDITQGLEEQIYTELPKTSETDYTKTDKTDRRINQTYLIVDKQNQIISGVVSNVTEQNNKISQITQTVDELNTKIQDIADITTAEESIQAEVSFTGINQSEPIMVKIHPITNNISYLYPRDNLYPSDTQYMPDRKIRFVRSYQEEGQTLTENIDYILPDDLLYYDSDHYDEFYLDYDSQTCQVTKRCKYNADGTVGLLTNEIVNTYTYPQILLDDGDYTVSILGYNTGYIYVRLMAQNIYTTQFATKAELNSTISQTASEINLEVSKKVGNNEVISKINQSAESVQITAEKIALDGKNINLTADNITIDSDNFSVDKYGNMSCANANITSATLQNGNLTIETDGTVFIKDSQNYDNAMFICESSDEEYRTRQSSSGFWANDYSRGISTQITADSIFTDGNVFCKHVYQTSLETKKKNFEKLDNIGIQTIKNIDIYNYNFKNENNKEKKHIGFIIGDKFKYSKLLTNNKNNAVDVYSFASMCCKAIQEQQEIIENLQKQIDKLKGEK